jgi:hypothetical protein
MVCSTSPSGWRRSSAYPSCGAPGADVRPTRPHRWLLGLLLIGWGGLIDHHLLGIHHVRGFGPDPVSDIGFLLTSPLLVPFGGWLYRSADLSRTSDLQP